MKRVPRDDRRAGFTLIEVLAALAIGSVIIMATAALIHDVARHFDRGTRGAQEAERLMLAVERLAQDFNSARFVGWTTEGGPAVAFTGEPASRDRPAKIMFVGNVVSEYILGEGTASLGAAFMVVSCAILLITAVFFYWLLGRFTEPVRDRG